MKLQKKWKYAVAFLVVLFAIYLTHPLYLKVLGHFLVVSDPLVKSDAIVVLDGDPLDERLLHDVLFNISPAYSSQFHPDEWWKQRADSRTFFYEVSKVLWYTLAE